jgi:hypothetical protein
VREGPLRRPVEKRTKRNEFGRIGLSFLFIFLAIVVVSAIVAYRTGIMIRYDSDRTFHSPIFSSDGSEIYFLSRSVSGVSWGPGIEFFTPPAKVFFLSDRISLRALDIGTKKAITFYTWKIPHENGTREEYRSRLFGISRTELTRKGPRVYFKIGLDVRKDRPGTSLDEWLTGYYDIDDRRITEAKRWEQSHEIPDPWPEDILSGDFEVINYRNKAILLREGKTGHVNTLASADGFWPDSLKDIPIEDYSHRERLGRTKALRDHSARLVKKFEAMGFSEGEAALKAGDELEKMGLYPKSPRITARGVEKPAGDYSEFQISSEEFNFGLFPDIEKAIHEPGTEIRFWGNYISHRDYDTSKRINEYLSRGNTQFYVIAGGKIYLMTISR